jgi:hypothetical protein
LLGDEHDLVILCEWLQGLDSEVPQLLNCLQDWQRHVVKKSNQLSHALPLDPIVSTQLLTCCHHLRK